MISNHNYEYFSLYQVKTKEEKIEDLPYFYDFDIFHNFVFSRFYKDLRHSK